jgi:hypothetical protein
MRRRARVDSNHSAIVEALRASGWHVHDCSRLGGGFPDLLAAKHGRIELIEVKDGAKVPSKQLLTPEESKVHQAFQRAGVPVVVVTSVDQAVNL